MASVIVQGAGAALPELLVITGRPMADLQASATPGSFWPRRLVPSDGKRGRRVGSVVISSSRLEQNSDGEPKTCGDPGRRYRRLQPACRRRRGTYPGPAAH